MATLTPPQTVGFVNKTSPLDGPITITDNPQVVTNKKDIQKVKYVTVAQKYATLGMRQVSFFMQKFGSRLEIINGFNNNMWSGIREDQTLSITLPYRKSGSFKDSGCDDVDYTGRKFAELQLKGGKVWDFTDTDCPPCPGDTCGEDAYDLTTAVNQTMEANVTFAQAFDYMMFTGKDISTGSAIPGYTGIFGNIQTSTTLGQNYVSDIERTLAHIKDEIANKNWSDFTGTDAGLSYLKGRNLRNDIMILATATGIAKIREHYNTSQGSNFQTLAQPSVVGDIDNAQLTVVGKWDSTVDVVEVPSVLMPADTEIAIVDLGRFFGKILCSREAWTYGDGAKNPFKWHYVKRFVFMLNDLSSKFGNYAYKI